MTKTNQALEIIHPGGACSTAPQTSLELSQRSDRIRAYHTGCRRSAEMQIIYGFLCGLELNAVKATLAHGNKKDGSGEGFMKWRENHHPDITHSTANRYMAVADALQEKLRTLRNFDIPDLTSRLYLTNGDLPETEKHAVLQAVREVTDATTISQLYRELDIVRQPTAKESPPGRKDLSPQDAAAAERAQSIEHGQTLLRFHRGVDDAMRAHWPDTLRAEIRDAILDEGKALDALKKKLRTPKKLRTSKKGRP